MLHLKIYFKPCPNYTPFFLVVLTLQRVAQNPEWSATSVLFLFS